MTTIDDKLNQKAIVLLSGGLDSTTCLAIAVEQFDKENVHTLSLHYGQKHRRELEAAGRIATHFGVTHEVVELPKMFSGAGSTLVDADKPNPEVTYDQIRTDYGVSPTYVPFRNANLLSAATACALVRGASFLFYGAHAEDARNHAYPDCTPEFNGAMANAIYVGTYHKVRMVTPLQWMMKKDIVLKARDLEAPISLTYSCYNGREKHCGKCPTCIERIQAFIDAADCDDVAYEIEVNWFDTEDEVSGSF